MSRVLALGTEAPENHFRLLDNKSMIDGRLQAGSLTDGTVHIGGCAAAPTDDMVVIVADACLVARRAVGGLNATHQPGFDQGIQVVVDSLRGEGSQTGAGGDRDGLRIVMLVSRFDGGDHGEPWGGNAQSCIPNTIRPVGFSVFHSVSIAYYLEPVNSLIY